MHLSFSDFLLIISISDILAILSHNKIDIVCRDWHYSLFYTYTFYTGSILQNRACINAATKMYRESRLSVFLLRGWRYTHIGIWSPFFGVCSTKAAVRATGSYIGNMLLQCFWKKEIVICGQSQIKQSRSSWNSISNLTRHT